MDCSRICRPLLGLIVVGVEGLEGPGVEVSEGFRLGLSEDPGLQLQLSPSSTNSRGRGAQIPKSQERYFCSMAKEMSGTEDS